MTGDLTDSPAWRAGRARAAQDVDEGIEILGDHLARLEADGKGDLGDAGLARWLIARYRTARP